MKFMRLAMCVAAFAVIGKVALSEDVDVRALQAKLASQEARLADLQSRINYNEANANYSGAPEGIVSLNKNATVTIGGTLNTRYFYRNGKVDSIYGNTDIDEADYVDYGRRAKTNQGDLQIADAKVYVQVDVNEYFDAFIHMNLQDSGNTASDNAEEYYVRWKNICNSGFGVLVGRTGLAFADDNAMGILGNYIKNGEGHKDMVWGGSLDGDLFNTSVAQRSGRRGTFGGALPLHNYWDQTRVIQVTPYWEGLDGKFKAEVSFFQNESNYTDRMDNGQSSDINNLGAIYIDGNKYKNRNYGFGSMSARLSYMPIEGLKLSGSIINFYDKYAKNTVGMKKNNTAVDFAVSYRPCFFNRLNLWAQYMHGWNVAGFEDVDHDTFNAGASFDINEQWAIFFQGDYMRTKDDFTPGFEAKDTAGALYGGIRYVLPYGVNVEAGWKHENIKWKNNDTRVLKAKADTAYIHLGFDF